MKEQPNSNRKSSINESPSATAASLGQKRMTITNLDSVTNPSIKKSTNLADTMLIYPGTSRKNSWFISQENPQILNEEKYEKIFKQILNDSKKAYRYFQKNEESKQKETVKRNISKLLKKKEDMLDFNQRFSIRPYLNNKHEHRLKQDSHIGQTEEEKERETRESFFSNNKKVINLEEECMLLEYYLKDEGQQNQKLRKKLSIMQRIPIYGNAKKGSSNQRGKVHFLKNIEQTSRYRRLTPNQTDAQNLHLTHDLHNYQSLKKRVHVKQQFVEKCAEISKKNPSYRRKQNFKEIEYIFQEHNKNILTQNTLDAQTNQDEQQLNRNNKIIRIFLNYESLVYTYRVEQYFTSNGISKFKEQIFALNNQFHLKEKEIDRKLQEIVEHKTVKKLQFQDFKELILFINQITKTDLIPLFQQKYPHYFERKVDKILKNHQQQIEKYMVHHKIKFLLQFIFNTYPQELIGKKLLPIKAIPKLFRAYDITSKEYQNTKLFFNYHWMQHYNAGLTFQQFYKGSILFGMKGNDWKGIEQLLKKIEIKKYLQK